MGRHDDGGARAVDSVEQAHDAHRREELGDGSQPQRGAGRHENANLAEIKENIEIGISVFNTVGEELKRRQIEWVKTHFSAENQIQKWKHYIKWVMER